MPTGPSTPRDPVRLRCLIVGLGLLALAQVFAEGARLRELERTTI